MKGTLAVKVGTPVPEPVAPPAVLLPAGNGAEVGAAEGGSDAPEGGGRWPKG